MSKPKVSDEDFVRTIIADSPFDVNHGEVGAVYSRLAAVLGMNSQTVQRRLRRLMANRKQGAEIEAETDKSLDAMIAKCEEAGGVDRRRRARSPSPALPTGDETEDEVARGHVTLPPRRRQRTTADSQFAVLDFVKEHVFCRMCTVCGAVFNSAGKVIMRRVSHRRDATHVHSEFAALMLRS